MAILYVVTCFLEVFLKNNFSIYELAVVDLVVYNIIGKEYLLLVNVYAYIFFINFRLLNYLMKVYSMSLKFNSLFNIFEIPTRKMNFTVSMHVCVCVIFV